MLGVNGVMTLVCQLAYLNNRKEYSDFAFRLHIKYRPDYDEYMKAKYLSVNFTLSKDKPWTFKNYLAYVISKVFL